MSDNLPWRSRGGVGENILCYNCNETGHIARDCTQSGGNRRRSRSRGTSSSVNRGSYICFNCNQSGHIATDCPSGEPGDRGRGRFGGRRRGTFVRGGGRGGTFGGWSESSCFNCNEIGHMSRDCPQLNSGGQGRGRGQGRRNMRGIGGEISFNFTRLGGRRRRGGGENEQGPKRTFFEDSD